MDHKAYVSVIIPVFRVENFIEKCARSLFEQTLQEIEYIFVDDCSDDDSIKILKSVLADYPSRKNQVIIHRMEVNSGQAAVRKWAMEHASGDYVIHCDSDDWIETDMYQTMYDAAVHEDAELVICDFFNTNGVLNKYTKAYYENVLPQGPLWNKLVKRSVYLNSDFTYPIANKAEDGAMVVQFFVLSKKTIYIPKAFYYYYANENSICRNRSDENCLNNFKQEKLNLQLKLDFLKKRNLLAKYKNDILRWKYGVRNNLTPLLYKKEYYKLWVTSFPHLDIYLLLNMHIALIIKYSVIIQRLKNLRLYL